MPRVYDKGGKELPVGATVSYGGWRMFVKQIEDPMNELVRVTLSAGPYSTKTVWAEETMLGNFKIRSILLIDSPTEERTDAS